MSVIYVWACGTWCHSEDLYQMDWMSDDFTTVKVSDTWTDDQIDTFVHNQF